MLLLVRGAAVSASPLEVADAAKAFGTMAGVRGMSLSPDGQRVSFIPHSAQRDLPIAMTIDLVIGKASVVTARMI